MAREAFDFVAGDTAAALQITLKDPGGTAHDVSSGTVAINWRVVTPQGIKGELQTATMTKVTASSGIVQYAWGANDLDLPGTADQEAPNSYAVHVEVVHTDGASIVSSREVKEYSVRARL